MYLKNQMVFLHNQASKTYMLTYFKGVVSDLLNPPGGALTCSSECLTPELSAAKQHMCLSALMFGNSTRNATKIIRSTRTQQF